jgi:hypothetical protein
MSRETLINLLRLVADKEETVWAFSHQTDSGYGSRSQATFALGTRIGPDEMCIGITCGPAKNGSPGRAWAELKPWRPGTKTTNERIKRWLEIRAKDRARFPISMAASVSEELAKLPPIKVRWRAGAYTGSNLVLEAKQGNPVVSVRS